MLENDDRISSTHGQGDQADPDRNSKMKRSRAFAITEDGNQTMGPPGDDEYDAIVEQSFPASDPPPLP